PGSICRHQAPVICQLFHAATDRFVEDRYFGANPDPVEDFNDVVQTHPDAAITGFLTQHIFLRSPVYINTPLECVPVCLILAAHPNDATYDPLQHWCLHRKNLASFPPALKNPSYWHRAANLRGNSQVSRRSAPAPQSIPFTEPRRRDF